MKIIKKINSIVVAVLMCVFGTLFILRPELTSTSICFILSICLAVVALSLLVRFFKERKEERIGNEMSAALFLAIGACYFAVNAENFVQIIPIILSFFIVYDGTTKVQNAYFLWQEGYKKWAGVLLVAGINIAIGVLLLWNPIFDSPQSLITALGVGLVFGGVADLVVLIVLAKFLKSEDESKNEIEAR